MPTAREFPANGMVDGKFYVFGGCCFSDASESYDPVNDNWGTVDPMPTARYRATAGVVDGIIYVIGGEAAGFTASTVEAYKP